MGPAQIIIAMCVVQTIEKPAAAAKTVTEVRTTVLAAEPATPRIETPVDAAKSVIEVREILKETDTLNSAPRL